jgi:hypothetical protein
MPDEEAGSDSPTAAASEGPSSRPGANRYGAGYHRLAQLMGTFPEVAIYRRFGDLNALNLLYYQAELIHLEHMLRYRYGLDYQSSDSHRQQYSQDWSKLHSGVSEETDSAPCDQQWQVMLKIRVLLKEYSEFSRACLSVVYNLSLVVDQAILDQHALSKLTKTAAVDRTFIQKWMKTASMGGVGLTGLDSEVWDEKTPISELQTISARSFDDIFSLWMSHHGFKLYQRLIGRHYNTVC